MKMYQLKYLFCFGKLSPSSPFMLNQAQNSKYNTTREFKLWQSLHTEHKCWYGSLAKSLLSGVMLIKALFNVSDICYR